MKDICEKYSTKLGIELKLLKFLYEGTQLDFDLTLKETNPSDDETKILVTKNELDGLICPKCGGNAIIDKESIDEIILNMNNIKEIISGIKAIVDNIIQNSVVNIVNIQLKNVNLLLNNVNEDISKNNEKIKNLIKDNPVTNYKENKNIIRGTINISSNEINKDIVLFNTDINKHLDVSINNQKVNVIKENSQWKYNFTKEGTHIFEIIFKNNISNMKRFFAECPNIISLDLSNFNTSYADNMSFMFNKCHKLKEIKGINKFNTNKATDMSAMFQHCNELEYLDLSNFDTSNVTNIAWMFNQCYKLKEIKGINKFNTNKVTDMNCLFQRCTELEYLDLSNFDTSNVTNMAWIFVFCHKLKEIKGINKFNSNKVADMKVMLQLCKELEHLDLSNFNTSKVTNMSWMFYNCNKLKYLNLLNFSINCETKSMLEFSSKKTASLLLIIKN